MKDERWMETGADVTGWEKRFAYCGYCGAAMRWQKDGIVYSRLDGRAIQVYFRKCSQAGISYSRHERISDLMKEYVDEHSCSR